MAVNCEVIHVAVGDDRSASLSLVKWAIRKFPGKNLRITHIFCPKITIWGGKVLRRSGTGDKVENRRESTLLFLDDCVSLCKQSGLAADTLFRVEETVEEGLVKLVASLNIRWLVIGAAASQASGSISSKKALHVFQNAPPFCQIWFVCDGNLLHTRRAVRMQESMSDHQSVVPSSSIEDSGTEESSDDVKDDDSSSDFREEVTPDSFLLQLREVITDAMSCQTEILEAQRRCSIAEANASGIAMKAKEFEEQYSEDLRQRKVLEEEIIQEKESHDKIKIERDSLIRDLQTARDQNYCLELQMAELHDEVRVLQDHAKSMADVIVELDSYKIQNENLMEKAKEWRKNSSILTFSESEIRECTEDFSDSRVIGVGGYGTIYRGKLHNTEVAVKVRGENNWQGEREYDQEVKVLGTMRHPNIIALIGVCPEKMALIYEYLPNGSLEDRLTCKNNTPPLSWQARIRVAIGLCSALNFLQRNARHCVVHGDLKPSNILLDAQMAVKLSDFGICRMLQHHEDSGHSKTMLATEPKGSLVYIDPEFLRYGELTPMSDVYSFGVVLLRLLTGKPATVLIKEAKEAQRSGRWGAILDTSAGDWPMELVEKIATLAMECCKNEQDSRPSIGDVWRRLEPMKPTETAAYCVDEPPSYFVCSISMILMEDPHVAADGNTYEKQSLLDWFELGHDTSPLTNMKLPHCNLVPNFALRSAIQDWVQQRLTLN